ncbi:DUF4190 domain-containing protein [Leucobacter sp. CSA2]|uniref:DUF4190 domain-containing protein n=1 Tax=Leucobacter edaphi TaxID=2796472 RepID=A0A934UYM9_9MICO|nr:DUF4190 domain-containing protein [Leucobacter edaphi]MBK0422432.1 DUF4190 domain-containing protein [Leucobacter edaphi]
MSDPTLPENEQGKQPESPKSHAPEQPQPPLQPGSSAQPPQPMQPPQSVQPPVIQPPSAPYSVPGVAPAAPGNADGDVPTPPAPPVPPQPGQPMAPQGAPQAPMNTLAIISFVGAFFIGLVGVVCGHISLSQIKKTGERGRGFALAGTIIGYVQMAIVILAIVFSFIVAGIATTAGMATLNEIDRSASASSSEELTESASPGDSTTEGTEGSESATPPAGGDLSPEYCAAVKDLAKVSSANAEDSAALTSALKKVGSVGESNSQVYSDMVKYIEDPQYAASSAGTDTLSKFTDVFTSDMLACG